MIPLKVRERRLLLASLLLSLALLGLRLLPGDPLRRMERTPYDFGVRLLLPVPADTHAVTVVVVDDESLVRLGQRWPLDRALWADFIARVGAYGPAAVALDAWFETPSPSQAADLALDTVDQLAMMGLTELPTGRLVAATLEDKAQALDADRRMAQALSESGVTLLGLVCMQRQRDVLDRGLPEGIVPLQLTLDLPPPPLPCGTLAGSLPTLALSARGAGGLSVEADDDGIVRRYPMWHAVDDTAVPSLAMAALQVARPDRDWLAEAARFDGGYPLLWQRPRDTIRTLRFSDVLEAPPGSPALAEALTDRIVFVGVSAQGTEDFVRTSRGGNLPGVYLHANATLDLLDGRFLQQGGRPVVLGVIAGGLLLVALILVGRRVRSAGAIVLLGLGAFVAWHVATALAFRAGYVLPVVAIGVGTGLWTATRLAYLYLEGEEAAARAEAIRSAFGLYLAPSVVQVLVDEPGRLKLGGERREITAFFTDLVGFTSMSEKMEPGELVGLLNECLGALTEAIIEEGGIVDKYIGDAIVAMFGAPLDQPDHAVRACRAAMRCQQIMAELRERFEREGKPPLRLRIGLNSGVALVGNMGSEQRFDYTMLGDTVNLAARLEGTNNIYGTWILAGEETMQRAPGVIFREVDAVRVKGRSQGVRVYSPLGLRDALDPEQRALLALASGALSAYRDRAWDEAEDLYQQLQAAGDPAARVFLERIAVYRESPPPPEWDGVFVMTTKG